jgi:hypothetical protein
MRADRAIRWVIVPISLLWAAGCSGIPPWDGPSKIWQEEQIPFISGTQWMPLVPSPTPIEESTVFVYGKDDYGNLANGDVEVVALFRDLPAFSGGQIANPEDCFWLWHNGMVGYSNAPMYMQGRPVFGGEIQYDLEPTIPPETAPGVNLDQEDVIAVAWIRGSDGYFWYASSPVPCTITIAP